MSQSNADFLTQEETGMAYLPIEIWMFILAFLMPHEEFPVAQVCRMFRSILTDQRNRRGDAKWQTDITPFCRSSRAIHTGLRYSPDTRNHPQNQSIVNVLLREQNYPTLVEFVEDQIWKNNICKVSLYTTLVEQKAYDAIRALIKKSIRTPIDFIESVVPTGQLDLIKHAHYSYPQFLFGDVSLLNVAIKTANLDVIKFVHEIMKRQYRQFRVSMLEFARTKNLEIVKFGLATFGRDIMWQDSIKFALSENLTDILEFLIDAGCPVDYWDKEKIEEQHPELHKRLKNREEERVQAHDYDFW